MISRLRLYGVAIWFGFWAAVRYIGEPPTETTALFLLVTAILVVVAERERQKLVRERRRPYRDGD